MNSVIESNSTLAPVNKKLEKRSGWADLPNIDKT